ncbi:MAG: PQQ-binding-like beta-propeller repeat protein [Saprospiraceae bacterium]|nr:PQQ-binding-like beta-propeller repeat protein [Saprospiraceae bacterium]
MKKIVIAGAIIGVLGVLTLLLVSEFWSTKEKKSIMSSFREEMFVPPPPPPPDPTAIEFDGEDGQHYGLRIINQTFMNNEKRNYYGSNAPNSLDILWKHNLGTGKTRVKGMVSWSGAGWTGQPLMVEENGEKYIIQGAYDHHLKKINAKTGELVWQYKYDDVLKGTGTLWINHNADSLKDYCVILQGSRSGTSLSAKYVPSFRAVSYFTGEELWRLNSVRTRCYSRDVDASALVLNDTAYLGLENGIFTIFDPDRRNASIRDGMFQPKIHKNTDTLFWKSDIKKHGGNLVTEASPSRLGDRVYLASGSGHVWGYNLKTDSIDWEYFIGSDIDGSPVVTDDNCLLISVEKQYIRGRGGLLKLDPSKPAAEAAVWYFPTGNRNFASWKGGIIGTASVNDCYKKEGVSNIAAFTAIDGFTYVIDTKKVEEDSVLIFDNKSYLPQPKLIYKYETGPAISSPILVDNKLILAGYDGIHLFEYDEQFNFKLLAKVAKTFEATPFVDDGKIYVASRDGNLYCFGEKPKIIQ